MTTPSVLITLCLILAGSHFSVQAADWPQVLGPQRNGIADPSEKIASQWKGRLNSPWSRPIGSGFAGLAVVGGRAVLFHREGAEEVIECLDALTGKPLWKDAHATTFRPQFGSDDGPLCTPTIAQGKVITYGAQGVLSCHDLQTGMLDWLRETHKDFGAETGYFGAGSSPLVVGDRIVVNVGGKKAGAGVVAFNFSDGATVWKKINDDASYSAPVVLEIEGLPVAIIITRLKCVGIEVPSGGLVFDVPFGARGPTVNGASPVLTGNEIFLTSSYGVGALSGRLEFPNFVTDYAKEEFFASQYATPVVFDGLFYGIDGRDDTGVADLKCFDPKKKTVLWSEASFGYGTQILVDGKLLVIKTNGELVLVEPNAAAYTELARDKVLDGVTRALPALSNGLLYVHDDTTLKCIDLRAAPR